MSGIIVKNKLKSGEKVIGRVEQVFEKAIVFEDKNDKRTKYPVPSDVAEQISEDYDGSIITLSVNADGDYTIEEHDDFPS